MSLCITSFTRSQLLSPNVNFYNTNLDKAESEKDESVFNFYYENKCWSYTVEKVEADFNFEINEKLNRYNREDKKQKILIIKYMQKLNYENKIIIKYLFPNLINKINKIKRNIEITPKNAEILGVYDNKIKIKKEIIGIKLNLNLFYKNILEEYINKNNININIPIVKVLPEHMEKDLQKYCNFRSVFSTYFGSSISDRKHNIRQASKAINNVILEKGEKFSFNKVVGRRTEENGYRTAKIIVAGEFVDGVGGGVCQVSTTLYNAVLKAGLKVTKSNKHSERIGYVKAGFDAMVNFGTSDLEFENDTGDKILIFSNIKEDRLYIYIFGESLAGYQYKLRSEEQDIVEATSVEEKVDIEGKYTDKVEYEDEYFYLKKATSGSTIKSYREVYLNGVLIKTELLRADKYYPQNAVKVYGGKKRPLIERLNAEEDMPSI